MGIGNAEEVVSHISQGKEGGFKRFITPGRAKAHGIFQLKQQARPPLLECVCFQEFTQISLLWDNHLKGIGDFPGPPFFFRIRTRGAGEAGSPGVFPCRVFCKILTGMFSPFSHPRAQAGGYNRFIVREAGRGPVNWFFQMPGRMGR